MQNSKITKLKAQRAKQHRLVAQERHTQEIEALVDVKASIQDLYSLINDQEKFDANKLSQQIETLAESLDIQDQVASVKEALSNLNPQVTIEKVDLEPLLKAIESNKPIPIDVHEMHNAIIEIRQRVQESSVIEQAPDEFQPVRRVVKVGNRLVFDDQPTAATRAGGGGSSLMAVNPSGIPMPLNLDADGNLRVDATITTGDIEIGAVELKNATTDDRVSVINSAPTTEFGLVTRNIPSGTQTVSGTITISQPATPTITSVGDSTTSVTIIAANSSRKEIEFINTSSATLYLSKGTSAATTSAGGYTVKIAENGYYRTNYTGAFRGIWDADVGGAVTITETT